MLTGPPGGHQRMFNFQSLFKNLSPNSEPPWGIMIKVTWPLSSMAQNGAKQWVLANTSEIAAPSPGGTGLDLKQWCDVENLHMFRWCKLQEYNGKECVSANTIFPTGYFNLKLDSV